jgi:hypothetical protein
MAPSFLAVVFALMQLVPTRLLDVIFRAAFGLRTARPPALQHASARP